MADTTIGMGLDMSEVAKALAQLPQMTGDAAEKAVGELTRAFNRADKSAKALAKQQVEAAKAAAEHADKIKHLGDRAGDTDTSLKAVAGAIGLISPEAEKALSSIGDLAGGLEGAVKGTGLLGVGLGTIAGATVGIGLVAAAVYGVWTATEDTRKKTAEWEDAINDVATATKTLASAQAALNAAGDKTAGFIGKLQIETAVLRGEIDQTDVRLGELGNTLSDTLRPQLDEARKAYQEQGEQVYKLNEAIASSTLNAGERVQAEIALNKAIANQDAIKGKIAAIKEQQIEGNKAISAYGEAVRAQAAEEEASRAATEKKAASTRSLSEDQVALIGATKGVSDAMREEAAQMRDAAKAADEAAKATSTLLSKSQEFASSTPDAITKTREEYALLNAEILRQIEANQKAGISTEALEAERVDLAKRTKNEIASLEAQARADKASADIASSQEAVDLQRSQQEAVLGAVSDTIGNMASAFSAYSDLIGEKYAETQDRIATARAQGSEEQAAALEEQNKKRKKALIALFVAEQAAALAQVAIDTALGFSAVTAAYAATPPLMLGLQALVVASGVAQAATISAARPSFHSGGVVPSSSAQQGEVMARLLPREVVLNRQAVDRLGGPAAADSLNRGGGMGGGTLVIEQRVGHRVFGETVYDDLRRPDSVLGKAIRGRARVGHRSR